MPLSIFHSHSEIDCKVVPLGEALDNSGSESIFHTGIKWSDRDMGHVIDYLHKGPGFWKDAPVNLLMFAEQADYVWHWQNTQLNLHALYNSIRYLALNMFLLWNVLDL